MNAIVPYARTGKADCYPDRGDERSEDVKDISQLLL